MKYRIEYLSDQNNLPYPRQQQDIGQLEWKNNKPHRSWPTFTGQPTLQSWLPGTLKYNAVLFQRMKSPLKKQARTGVSSQRPQ